MLIQILRASRREKGNGEISLKSEMLIIAECEKFNATFTKDLNDKFKKIEDDIKKHVEQWAIFEDFIDIKKHGEQWTMFEDFIADYETIEQEEWSIYRRKPYIFADFLSKWESQTSNMITIT